MKHSAKFLLAAAMAVAAVVAPAGAQRSAHKVHDIDAKSYPKTDMAWEAYDAFNDALLDRDKFIYKENTAAAHATDRFHGAAAIWCQPIFWDMAMNAYKLASDVKDKKRRVQYKFLCRKIFEGNKAHYCGFDFDDNNENTGWFIYDDIMWWTISLARAYELFGNKEYLELAERSFERVWYGSPRVGDTGSYDAAGGGMFRRWYPISNPEPNKAGDGKMACINFPAVVAALTLYNNVPSHRVRTSAGRGTYPGRAQYLERGKEIYEWGVTNLFDSITGRVADSKHGDGAPDVTAHVYNQATFIGASVLLFKATGDSKYLTYAYRAADHVVDRMSAKRGLLPFESGIEQGIYTAIFAQYIGMLVYDCGAWQYLPFLRRNIRSGWDNRDTTRALCGGEYDRRLTEGETIDSYSASGIPALMLVLSKRGLPYPQSEQ